MFAVIDVETTGLSPRSEKITEIAIYIHDGKQVVDEFSSLINPEKKIPYRITAITGISNKMVEEAPRFYEIAKQIVELTDGKVVVGHNVNFDYNFIRHEFKRLGYEYKRKTFCTCRMSKKAFPGRRSYGLGKLCRELNISNHARHRAAGDALATTRLFEMIRAVDPELAGKPPRTLNTNLNRSLIDKLPEQTGVYYFFNDKGDIIYVGKSTDIKSRVLSHLSNNMNKRAVEMRDAIADISCELTGSELIALLLESHEIKKYKPLYNRAQRRSRYNYGLYSFEDDQGYVNLKITRIVEGATPINCYGSKMEARNHLFKLVEEHRLCQKLCGLYDSQGSCFHYQIRECLGACVGEETPDAYNSRVVQAIEDYSYPCRDFFLLDHGRNPDEKAVVKIENGKYIGFGYVGCNGEEPAIELLHDCIKAYPDNKDIRQILRSYLKVKHSALIPL
ncbi:MAG: GIY-YIG nuclease family protein [Bacteroidales bacterium]|nr:GIY-YIG nuclease family protein [Bacteroidales bacterium]MCF8376512.1 GIY-YIG nuclease family protein [Bacteroidales bacterium]